MTEDLALGGTKTYLEKRQQVGGGALDLDEDKVTPDSILEGLDICLKNNFFKFNEKSYKQISGIGTGLKLAPPYACLGMGEFEKIAFSSNQPLLDLIILWKRYIDDVFGLFKGTKEEFHNFVDWLNSLIPGVVKFTANISYNQVEFLDIVIKIENGRLKTDLFIKPSNLQLYLNYDSNHHQPCKTGLMYSQALRVVERCTDVQDANCHLQNLKEKFVERKYPENVVVEQIDRAKKKDRRCQIYKKKSQNKPDYNII